MVRLPRFKILNVSKYHPNAAVLSTLPWPGIRESGGFYPRMATRGRTEQAFLDQNQDSTHPEYPQAGQAVLTPIQALEGVCGKAVVKGMIQVSPWPSAREHQRWLVLILHLVLSILLLHGLGLLVQKGAGPPKDPQQWLGVARTRNSCLQICVLWSRVRGGGQAGGGDAPSEAGGEDGPHG